MRSSTFGRLRRRRGRSGASRECEDGSAKPATVERGARGLRGRPKTRGGDVGNVTRVGCTCRQVLGKVGCAAGLARTAPLARRARKMLAPATVNRTCTGLKAALNLAAEHDERIGNRRAWETGLATIPDAEQSRNVILSEPAVRDHRCSAPAKPRSLARWSRSRR